MAEDVRYEFRVRGQPTRAQLRRLSPLTWRTTPEGDTVLEGRVRDQAELVGFIARLSATGLQLLQMRPSAP